MIHFQDLSSEPRGIYNKKPPASVDLFSNFCSDSHSDLGLLIVDRQGRVLFSDQTSQNHLNQGQIARLHDGCLKITAGSVRLYGPEIFGAVPETTWMRLVLHRRNSQPAEVRLRRLTFAGLVNVVAAIIVDPEQGMVAQLRETALRYRLSPAEIELCVLLVRGESLTTVSTQLGVSYPAVRARLRRIFEKTGVQRQAELVSMLLSGPAACEPSVRYA